ncbi:TPA: hypothetical protein N0F65_009121 [Lagenidium giganteum]|uniref:PH domain-containing protein n=1 Tax=Lagenidium giganteum TaxID=4803 RepID=A0AAV2YRL6_9STRA|nr:TPA: hypothetical protein N0F65_009121 [Lagenidium giganteum]
MNVLSLTGVVGGADTQAKPKVKPTSCEGYVTKRGHFRKSWRVRYLVLNGADLRVAYYESKDAFKANGDPKGAFFLSSVEKHEYWVGVMGAKEKPFGFKLVGHAPKKGYVELDIFVECLGDLNKWLAVAMNALDAAKRMQRSKLNESLSPKNMFGVSSAMNAQQQMQKLQKTKEEMLKDALRDIEAAKATGREACTEIVVQGQELDNIEHELGHVHSELDYGEHLLKKMKNPMMHLFSRGETRRLKLAANGGAGDTSKGGAKSAAGTNQAVADGAGGPVVTMEPTSDLERLAMALGELEQQAELMNFEAKKSTQQIARIEEQLNVVNDRVQEQMKTGKAVLKSGHIM